MNGVCERILFACFFRFPEPTYDVAWSTEFLEHLSREYADNYIPTLKRAAIVMVSGELNSIPERVYLKII